MRKMVNDYLPEKEDLMDECRSNFENACTDGFREYDDLSLRRNASQIFITCRHFKSLVVISNDLTNINSNYVMFCDQNASENIDFLRILLNITCSRHRAELPKDSLFSAAATC
uniref:Uncharacterized protein n=1 Tax=Wuchereria bancrofti TaxID=6293 RepID=A0A1I8F081_WUCBA